MKNINLDTLKSENRALILNEIRKSPVSRAGISLATGLSRSAVTTIVNELVAEGQLCDIGSTISTSRGRRPILVDIVGNHRYAVGVLRHRRQIGVVLTNLKAEPVAEISAEPDAFQSRDEAVAWIVKMIHSLIRQNKIPTEKIVGIGVSSPGPLDHSAGIIMNPPNFKLFARTPIVKLLHAEFDLPIILENNAVLLAMGEYFLGGMKHFRNSLFITISSGIGSCIMLDGCVYRGNAGFAGELGHMSIDWNGPLCACKNKGCVELYATLSALRKKFNFSDYKEVVDAAYLGEQSALMIIDYEADCLSAALVNAVNILDLDSVILHGEFNYRPEMLISKIHGIVCARSFVAHAHPVEIFPSVMDERSMLITATAAVLDKHFTQRG